MIGETDDTFYKPMHRVPYQDRGTWTPLLSPAADVTLSHTNLAEADTYGRGVLSVSNKPSEVNILEIPIFFLQSQLGTAQFDAFTPKVLSQNIGGSYY
jgi:hypothetical protein